jgi:RHS repeat-associated protein
MKSMATSRVSAGHPVDIASGTLFHDHTDRFLPGLFPLRFGRRYSSQVLANPRPLFGDGWASPFEIRITIDESGYRLVSRDGDVETPFSTTRPIASQGAVYRNLGATLELRHPTSSSIEVLAWNYLSTDVYRFLFYPDSPSLWLLSRVELVGGGQIQIHRGRTGLIERLVQLRERRGFRIKHNTDGLAEAIFLFQEDEPSTLAASRPPLMRYAYDRQARLVAATDAQGNSARYEYDRRGRLTRETTVGGRVFRFAYDEAGRCTTASGLEDFARVDLAFDDQKRLTRVTDSLGNVTTYSFTPAGLLERTRSPLGHETRFVHDDLGRIVQHVDADGRPNTFTYDADGNRQGMLMPGGGSMQFLFNGTHQLTTIVDAGGYQWSREYDSAGRLVTASDPTGASWRYSYNMHGDIIGLEDPHGRMRMFVRDGIGALRRAIDPAGATVDFDYTDEGAVASWTDSLQHRTAIDYDELGRIRALFQPDGTVRRFAWSPTDQLTTYIDERSHVTRYRYATCGQLIEVVRPDSSSLSLVWSTEPGQLLELRNSKGESLTYQYDEDHRLTAFMDFAGRRFEYGYSPAGRLLVVREGEADETQHTWDAAGRLAETHYVDGRTTRYRYDARGMVVEADNGDVKLVRTYDAVGRLLSEFWGDMGVRNTYDALGFRVHRELSTGYTVSYDWDVAGRLTRIAPRDSGSISVAYDKRGNEILRSIAGGSELRFSYDSRRRCTGQQVHDRRSASPSRTRTIDYDPCSNVTRIADSISGETRFRYDALSRFEHLERSDGLVEHYTYDHADNLLRREKGSHGATSPARQFTYARGSRLAAAGSTPYGCDSAGRLVARGVGQSRTTFHWNGAGQLQGVGLPAGTSWKYVYDAFGRRISKSCDNKTTTTFIWDDDVIAGVLSSDAIGVAHFTAWEFDPSGFAPIAKVDQRGTLLCLNDVNGAPLALLDREGTFLWEGRSDAFGVLHSFIGEGDECPIRYQGQWHDGESGLHYNRFRYYDPEVGRFISPDPMGLSGGTNPYIYAPNTTSWIDPYGLAKVPCEKAVQAAVDHAVANIPGLSREQAEVIVRGAFSRGSSVTFGGSRVRGNHGPGSDLDVGFGSLSTSQAGKVIDRASSVPGGLPMETTRIVPGNETPHIPRIQSPEEFFMRSGTRGGGDPRAGEPYTPSGYITYSPDGSATHCQPDGTITRTPPPDTS